MTGRAPCRRRKAGFSSLYGAFGVVLVSLVVAGLIAQSAKPLQESPRAAGAAASGFLEALLGSTVGAQGATLRQYLSHACLEEPCGPEAHARAPLEANLSATASALAGAMGRQFGLALYTPSGQWFRIGLEGPRAGARIACADVFHPESSSFLTVAAWLAPA